MMKGWKTWLGAAPLILGGLAGLLQQLAGVHDLSGLLQFAAALNTNPHAAALLAGIAAIGLGHKADRILGQLNGADAAGAAAAAAVGPQAPPLAAAPPAEPTTPP